jgi:hypothetical protein
MPEQLEERITANAEHLVDVASRRIDRLWYNER